MVQGYEGGMGDIPSISKICDQQQNYCVYQSIAIKPPAQEEGKDEYNQTGDINVSRIDQVETVTVENGTTAGKQDAARE